MADLWGALGYDRWAADIAEGLGGSAQITVIKGPPGVGKSWLAKGVGALWESAGGSAVVAEGDLSRSDVSLYPFEMALDDLKKFTESMAVAVATLARVGELLIGTGGVLTTSLENLARLQSEDKTQTVMLDRQELDVMARLSKLSRRRPLLVIADNLHWWDARSLEFLGRLRDNRIVEAFPFLREMRVLGVETAEPHQSVAHPQSHKRLLLPHFTRTLELEGIPREGFEDVLVHLGAPARPSREDTDLIYKFSGGHLLLAHRCATRLREDEDPHFLSAESPDEFVQDLLDERVRVMGPAGEEALGVLQIAAASGLTFRQDALICAAGASESDTSRLLRHCSKEAVLELRKGTGRFVHDFYRQYFLSTLGEERVGIHEVLGDCMRKLDPAAYEARCVNALVAEQEEEAAALAAQAALQRQRDGLPWRNLPRRVLDALESGDLTEVTERFQIAYAHLTNYRSRQCLQTLNNLPHQLPTCLVAEGVYLRATCLVTTRSERDRRDAQVMLEAWSDYVEQEPELGLRLMRLRLYHLALQIDKEPALRLENEIRRILQERQAFDRAAEDALYTLDRLAGCTQRSDLALDMNQRAVRYFGSTNEQEVLRRPVEYYLSLLNLEANLIGRGSYEEALGEHRQIEELLEAYGSGAFPRVDYPMTNALLAEYRLGAVGIAEAVDRQGQIVADYGVPDDPFFAENALAVYFAIHGSYGRAIEIQEHLAAQLLGRGDPEPSLLYLVRANCVAARFLQGVDREARREWSELAELVNRIPYGTAPEMLRRHQLLAAAMSDRHDITPRDFDETLLEAHGFGPELRHGFWLPAIEWWR